MKLILIATIILLGVFCFVGRMEITLNPFSVSMPYWYRAAGWLLIWFGAILLVVGERVDAYKDGFKKGLDKGSEITIEAIKKRID